VAEARNKRSVLHREFDWDDKSAAHTARLDRAQELITRYITIVVIDRSVKLTAPLYVRDPQMKSNEGGYLSLEDKITRPDARSIMLTELDRCRFSIERARSIANVLDAQHRGIANELEEMLMKIVDLRDRLGGMAAE
jgi:hypothetical protein